MLIIATLNWNGKDKLQELYPTLINSLSGIDYKWFIKDNGSTDNSIELEKEWNNPNVHFIAYTHNRDNFAQGCNLLFKEAAPKPNDFFMLLNNDITFGDKNSLKNMISLFSNKDIGLVGSKLLYKNTNKIQHNGVIFDKKRAGLPQHFMVNRENDDSAKLNRSFQAVTGALWLTKAEFYENICRTNANGQHGLCDNYTWMFEDISGALSIKYELKKQVICCGNTQIFHEESATLKKNPVNRLFFKQNVDLFLNQWRGRYIVDKDSYENNPKYNVYK